jgi:predicted RNA methylase
MSEFDEANGTDTDGTLRLSTFTIPYKNARFGMSYQPTDPRAIIDAMRYFGEDPAQFRFFDLGSGKGRIVVGAARMGFKSVTGVEFVDELAEICRANLERLNLKHVTIHRGDAAEFRFPDDDLVVYFGNPFRKEIMEYVTSNLRRARFRKLYVIYRVPRCAQTLDASGFLRPLGELPGWEGEFGVKIWEAVHQLQPSSSLT